MGIEQTIIEGRRVTDDATLEMAKMIFAGKINTDILAALRNRGIEAVGLSGVDGNIVHAERRPPKEILNRETGERSHVDFGHVGDVVEINSRLLTVLLDQGYLPVISSLGADAEGTVFNINADTIAAEIAAQLKAEKLILLSDVDGLYLRPDEPETKLSRLTAAEAKAMIADGTRHRRHDSQTAKYYCPAAARRAQRPHPQRHHAQRAAHRNLHRQRHRHDDRCLEVLLFDKLVWSAATCRRFVPGGLTPHSLRGLQLASGCDRSQPTKALTGQRTPKRQTVDTAYSNHARFAEMDNEAIARRFFRLAALMDIRGDDPFRLRSYRNAAEAIETWPVPMKKIAARKASQGCSRFPAWAKRLRERSSNCSNAEASTPGKE